MILLVGIFYGDFFVSIFSKMINCPFSDKNLTACLGISLIVRVSLALLLFHLIVLILLFTRDNFAKYINEECFLLKILIVMGFIILLFLIPNEKLYYYVAISKFLSMIFLLYQSITLIDFGYVWNEVWVEKYENGTTFYGVLLIVFSIILLVSNIFLLILNINEFWAVNAFNKFAITFAILMIIVFIVLVLMKIN